MKSLLITISLILTSCSSQKCTKPQTELEQAVMLHEQKKYKERAAILEKILIQDPTNIEVTKQLYLVITQMKSNSTKQEKIKDINFDWNNPNIDIGTNIRRNEFNELLPSEMN